MLDLISRNSTSGLMKCKNRVFSFLFFSLLFPKIIRRTYSALLRISKILITRAWQVTHFVMTTGLGYVKRTQADERVIMYRIVHIASVGRVFRHFLSDPCNSFEISEWKREQGHRDDTCYQPTANRRNRRSVNNTGTVSQLRMDSQQRWCVIFFFFCQRLVGFIAIRVPSASGTNTRFASPIFSRSVTNSLSISFLFRDRSP